MQVGGLIRSCLCASFLLLVSELSRESPDSKFWGKCPHALNLSCIDLLCRGGRHGCIGSIVFAVLSALIVARI
jgi:hypothetical protein